MDSGAEFHCPTAITVSGAKKQRNVWSRTEEAQGVKQLSTMGISYALDVRDGRVQDNAAGWPLEADSSIPAVTELDRLIKQPPYVHMEPTGSEQRPDLQAVGRDQPLPIQLCVAA